MAAQGRSRRGRQVTICVLATKSTNKVQESDEISINPHEHVGQNVEESMTALLKD